MATPSALLAGILLLGAGAGAPSLDGEYDSPLGRVRISGDGTTYRGKLVEASPACAFRKGDEVLRVTLLDDSLAGQVRVCLEGDACPEAEWASAVLLAGKGRLSGALHVAATGCTSPAGKNGGLTFLRVARGKPAGKPAPASASTADRAREVLRDGAAFLAEGNFEAARRRFLEAIQVDPGVPEAYNGVGVTYRMRNDLARALDWYKKALAVDPDFGDAYYNMACVYSMRGERELALRYLQIAALNGYATAEGIGADPDLEPLRADPAYRALVRAKM
ncbi:MAG TPA: tetratricopeptide repeat protein [Anaeromyxobacteraceae bacterium]|nr:tetratricopeptide repeat protein [Anaeromyxobacteraceae bacterium]